MAAVDILAFCLVPKELLEEHMMALYLTCELYFPLPFPVLSDIGTH